MYICAALLVLVIILIWLFTQYNHHINDIINDPRMLIVLSGLSMITSILLCITIKKMNMNGDIINNLTITGSSDLSDTTLSPTIDDSMKSNIINKYIFASDVYSLDQIKQMFADLANPIKYRPHLEENNVDIRHFEGDSAWKGFANGDAVSTSNHSDGKNHVALIVDNELEKKAEIITDYFVDRVRVRCDREPTLDSRGSPKTTPSMHEYFEKHTAEWMPHYLSHCRRENVHAGRASPDTHRILRDVLTRGLYYQVCATFPWSPALAIYRIFKPRRILDMAAGWGDRMLAAAAYGAQCYVGADPNSNLVQPYRAMIRDLNLGQHYGVICKPFEDIVDGDITEVIGRDVDLSEGHFDMMFSCPPYFSSEHYSDDEGQSSARYKTLDDWLTKFMFASMDKCWRYLAPGGFLCLVINDTALYKFVQRILEHITKLSDDRFCTRYLGGFKYIHNYGKHAARQPVWIAQKVPKIITPDSCRSFMDPEPVIKDAVTSSGKTVHVIREDQLIGGTKQRVVLDVLSKIQQKHVFYRGPTNGAAQIALSYGCALLGKQFHMVVNKQFERGHGGKMVPTKYVMTLLAMIFGCRVHEVDKIFADRDLAKRDPGAAEKWIAEREAERMKALMAPYENDGGVYEIPLGLRTDENIELYKQSQLKNIVDADWMAARGLEAPKKMWMVASSGLIYSALWDLTRDLGTTFEITLVGHKHYENFHKERTTIHEAPEHFRELAKLPPPYPSESSYDAKGWQFVDAQAADGDMVFNVAGI